MGLPIVIYNVVPWNTVAPETLLRLSEIPQVIAVKQSGGDIHKLAELLRLNNGRLQVLSAVDDLLYPSFVLGAQGGIAAILTIRAGPRGRILGGGAARRSRRGSATAAAAVG